MIDKKPIDFDQFDDARPPAERGAALLDQLRPGWAAAIDTARLDLASSYNCILGQLFGSFCNGYLHLLKHFGDLPYRVILNDHFGFTADSMLDYAELTTTWGTLIEQRLEEYQ